MRAATKATDLLTLDDVDAGQTEGHQHPSGPRGVPRHDGDAIAERQALQQHPTTDQSHRTDDQDAHDGLAVCEGRLGIRPF